MQFVGIDADYRTVDLVEVRDVVEVLPVMRVDVEVDLVVPCHGGEFGTGESSDWGEVETGEGCVGYVGDNDECYCCENLAPEAAAIRGDFIHDAPNAPRHSRDQLQESFQE